MTSAALERGWQRRRRGAGRSRRARCSSRSCSSSSLSSSSIRSAFSSLASLQVGPYGQATEFGFGNWVSALTDPNLRNAIVNTLTLTVTRQGIAFVLAIGLAWLLARTDLPGPQLARIRLLDFVLPADLARARRLDLPARQP